MIDFVPNGNDISLVGVFLLCLIAFSCITFSLAFKIPEPNVFFPSQGPVPLEILVPGFNTSASPSVEPSMEPRQHAPLPKTKATRTTKKY